MNHVLIIGAGGVANVVAHKCAEDKNTFHKITLASRTLAKCDAIAAAVKAKHGVTIDTRQIDADDVPALTRLLEELRPQLVLNIALPYQDLHIMDACLAAGIDYLDTANYEPPEEAKFEYKWQWAYDGRYRARGIMALLGSGFDPGVTNVFTAYIKKHLLDEIHELDIIDANAGDHGLPFATNFNPEIKTARFWMTFSDNYLNHLKVLENVGMTSIEPVMYEGREIIPIQFLKAVLPDPASLGPRTKGKTCIGCVAKGSKDGKAKTVYIYNICDHEAAYRETGSQAISYTTGVPAMIGAKMMLEKTWHRVGVWNMEQFDPDPFLEALAANGLPWEVKEL